jgi:hypothetical protein
MLLLAVVVFEGTNISVLNFVLLNSMQQTKRIESIQKRFRDVVE